MITAASGTTAGVAGVSIRLRGGIENIQDVTPIKTEDALVLERGRIVFRGRTAELREDEALQHRRRTASELHRHVSGRPDESRGAGFC